MTEENNEYIQMIPEEYREVPTVRDAGSLDNLLQGYVNLEQKLGNAVIPPASDADAETWDKFYNRVNDVAPGLVRLPTGEEGWDSVYNKLGRPESPDEYVMPEIKTADGKTFKPPENIGELREHAHKMGMTGKQFAGMMEYFANRTVAQQEAAQRAIEETMGTLRREWGDATEARTLRAQEVVRKFAGDKADEVINAFGELGNNPQVLMLLDRIAEATMEEGSLSRQTPGGDAATRASIEDEIAELRSRNAFMDRKDPDHQRIIDRINALYERLEQYKAA